MLQKFKSLSFIHIKEDSDSSCAGCDGIIKGTYAELFKGNSKRAFEKYDIYIIENNKVVSSTAWVDESDIILHPLQDRDKAEKMIQAYLLDDSKY